MQIPSEPVAREIISLPMFAELTPEQIEKIVEEIGRFIAGSG
jgi:dTDP-4-amino-4,6-dideoxygalactose transaminase